MSAEPVYTPPLPIRDRLHRLAAAEQRVAAREAALKARLDAVAAGEARAKQLEEANKKRARTAKRTGLELADMNERLVERKRELLRRLQATEQAIDLAGMPNMHGGPDGLYRAGEEAAEYEREKKKLARRAGQNVADVTE